MAVRDTHHRSTGATNYAALNVRVDGLAEDVSQIQTRLNKTATSDDVQRLAAKIDALSTPKQPQTMLWIAAATFLTMVVSGFYITAVSPVKADLMRIESSDRDYRKDTMRILEKLADTIVPRGEHEQRWRSIEGQAASTNARIDEIGRKLADVYSPKDALQDLRQQISDLRAMVNDRMEKPK